MRRAVLGVLAVITAIGVSGCVVFDGTPEVSQHGIGPVSLTFTVCSEQLGGGAGSCAGSGDNSSAPSQIWVGFQVPRGTGLATKFRSSAIDATSGPTDSGPQIPFTASSWYSAALERTDPAPSGYEWAGYVSSWQTYNITSGPQNFTATVDFGLPPGKGGKPYTGPFDYVAIVGGQQYNKGSSGVATPPSDTPDCENDGQDNSNGSSFTWLCLDDSYPEVISPATTPVPATFTIINAGFLPVKQLTASRGSTKTLHFTLDYQGPPLGEAFHFSATSTLHGAKVHVTPATFNPSADSSKQVTVTVNVPKTARSATYKVTVKAELPVNSQTRTGTAELKVH